MPVVEALIKTEENGTISFGNYELEQKTKLSDFEFAGDLYKVKTYRDITRLEKNGSLEYESTPGTAVHDFKVTDREVTFFVEGFDDSQITLELESDSEYKVVIDDLNSGNMKTKLGGKLTINVPLGDGDTSKIKITKIS
jgi:hypothetical protein